MNKFKETIKIFEDEIFKAASNEEANKRQQEYALNYINKILKNKGTQNPDGSWDVDGDVIIRNLDLSEIPVKFNKVNGSFVCSYNKLTSLEGCPKIVGNDFGCSHNKLISLEGCPKIVNGDFFIYCNDVEFDINYIKKHCKIKGSIYT